MKSFEKIRARAAERKGGDGVLKKLRDLGIPLISVNRIAHAPTD